MQKKKKRRVPNYPRIILCALPLLVLIAVIIFVVRIAVWNRGKEYGTVDPDLVALDTKDNIILMPRTVLNPESFDGTSTVLVFGNDTYCDGLNKNESILDDLQSKLPDVQIINCCLPGTYISTATEQETSPEECPLDYFSMEWLALGIRFDDYSKHYRALDNLDSSKYDVQRYKEVLTTLENLDFNSVEVVMFCYDGHDYLNGNMPYAYNDNGVDIQTENSSTLIGALYTSVFLYNYMNPEVQYVFVSPAFCYATDENGKKISCAMYDTGYGNISENYKAARLIDSYFGVSYIDMYSGVLINEDNATAYLEKDGITPNKKGKEMITDRLFTLLEKRL